MFVSKDLCSSEHKTCLQAIPKYGKTLFQDSVRFPTGQVQQKLYYYTDRLSMCCQIYIFISKENCGKSTVFMLSYQCAKM